MTTGAGPTAEGLPADIAEILKTPAAQRNDAQRGRLLAHLRSQQPEMLHRDFAVELARRPLPEDDRQKELELNLARATRPVPVDPVLAQLRQDAELSSRQLAQKRLTATQDLAWALINTPAFLFNR